MISFVEFSYDFNSISANPHCSILYIVNTIKKYITI